MCESRGRDVVVEKKLTANDLGLTGSHQVGICIPQPVVRLGFFPELDTESFNPECPIAARVEPGGRSVALKYIYYNGRLTGRSTRNEYRLTRTTGLFRMLTAQPGDLLRFRLLPSGEIEISVRHEDDDDFRVGVSPPAGSGDRSSSGSTAGSSREISSRNGWTVIEVDLSHIAKESGSIE